jgi:zinc protease
MKMRFGTLVLVLALSVASLAMPGPAAQSAPAMPDLTYKRLLNDLQLIVAPAPPGAGDEMTVGLVLRYGATFDPIDKGGVGYLLTRMLGKATLDRSSKDIQDELSYLGVKLDVRCGWDAMYFFIRGQSARYERYLLLLYQVVGEAVFDDAEFAKVKAEVLEEIGKQEDPRQQVRGRFEAALFRGTTYGRPIQGTRASIQNITAGDVRLFYRRFFSPNSAALSIVGSIPVAQVLQKATRIWGVWVRKEEVPFSFIPPRKPSSRNVYFQDDPASPAAQFILGNLWPRREDPEFYAANLAARLLQDRMTKALPTSLVTVASDPRRLLGPFYIQGQAAADQAVGEIQKILDLVEEFKAAPVTDQDLAAAQKRWIDEFNTNYGTVAGLCTTLLDSELYRLGTNYAASFPDLVKRSDAEAIKTASKDWVFPGGVIIVVRGPAAALKAGLESLGELQPLTP